jgi:hypothetical protein
MNKIILVLTGCVIAIHPLPSQYVNMPVTPMPADKKPDINNIIPRKNIISFGFFSPVNGHLSFGYDRLIGQEIVFTGQAGYIGWGYGIPPDETLQGGFLEAGIKLYFHPDYIIEGMRRYNSMQGMYFKPELIGSAFQETDKNNYFWMGGGPPPPPPSYTYKYGGLAVILNIGEQWIFGRYFSLDVYAGMGYLLAPVAATNSTNEPTTGNYYGFEFVPTGGPASIPLVFTGGANLGVPF